MKVIIKKDIFLLAVVMADRATGRGTTLPVLGNILLRGLGSSLTLTATDLELALSVIVPAKIEEEGALTIPTRVLIGFLNGAAEGNAALFSTNTTLSITTPNNKTTIKGEAAGEYPLLPKTNKKEPLIMPATKLVAGLRQVINTTAVTDTKPELTGVFLQFTQNEIVCAATDSFRLAERTIPQQNTTNQVQKIILPLKTAQEVIKVFQENQDDVYIYNESGQFVIENKEGGAFQAEIISKVIEGEYPEYRQIIPREFAATTVAKKTPLVQAVKTAGLFASKIHDVRVSVAKEEITIAAQDQDVGDFTTTLAARTEGENLGILFNYRYLLDGLQNIEGDEVRIKFSREDGPAILEPTTNQKYLYILMPIRNS
jgi:DNA polymerase III subunit beta